MKITATVWLNVEAGRNINPETIPALIKEAVSQSMTNSLWVFLPGSQSTNPDEKIITRLNDVDIEVDES